MTPSGPSLCLIVLGGEPPAPALLEYWYGRATFAIGADGGVDAFLQAGVMPNVAIGDFDSFQGDLNTLTCRVDVKEQQDSTDFEKALGAVPENIPFHHFVILGATGGRLDHSLTNLLIAGRAFPESRFEIIDDQQRVIRVNAEWALHEERVESGQTISLVPFDTATGVSATGLHWPLNDATLRIGGLLGQSNMADSESISVSISSGLLFVILNMPGNAEPQIG
ncbi:MAG: thiamine diphosphokinase [Opitutales bacterium]|nr:thiamine diphosphokinase [Opitutales bacterium]NRA26449.1 thiamine diphosphokinase [Opitutales bacterium]